VKLAMASTTDVAFTPAVKALQERRGSRRSYARLEQKGGWPAAVTPELAAFIAERNSLYFATASSDGQPYVQHRGGAKGFLQVLDERTLALDDLEGNRQYVTLGNLSENPKAFSAGCTSSKGMKRPKCSCLAAARSSAKSSPRPSCSKKTGTSPRRSGA